MTRRLTKTPGYRFSKEVYVFKTLPPALLSAALIAMAGCQASPSTDTQAAADAQAFKTFTVEMQRALERSIALAPTGRQLGAVTLQVTFDRHSAPVACKASKAPFKYGALLPADVMPSDHQALANLVEALCWKTIYPVVPASLFGGEATLDVRAPIIVQLPASIQAPGSARQRANAQREYFWQQLLRDQPVTSIGKATVFYQANAQGKVEGCLVQLSPTRLREAAFRLDGNLQAQLNSRCMKLDLSTMPGFSTNEQGTAEGYSELDYAPWKVGRQ
ncbi:hypothetical protein PAGU2196_10300 [Pseudomonas sp. PAGU 2196]|nr:hypothetical protein PAGU2196_10300 [Pseudomonas sp. PAGU 2196]